MSPVQILGKGGAMAGTDNIILIGMPGAGKSTLGIVLAKILNYRFLDADLLIQQQCDKTLQKLIDACGPDGFIQVENDVLSEIEADRTVIATGGSAVYSDEAMKHLASIGTVVYLKISYEQLVHRLSDLQERGVVLKGGIRPYADMFYFQSNHPAYFFAQSRIIPPQLSTSKCHDPIHGNQDDQIAHDTNITDHIPISIAEWFHFCSALSTMITARIHRIRQFISTPHCRCK